MNRKGFALTAGLGCAVLTILMLVVIPAAFLFPFNNRSSALPKIPNPLNLFGRISEIQASAKGFDTTGQVISGTAGESLSGLYIQLKPAVVAIRAYQQGEALQPRQIASGIVLDGSGHILTSYPIDPGADYLTVVFSGGLEKSATQVGHDEETGLAILKVEGMTAGAQSLEILQVDEVSLGETVVAIAGGADRGGAIKTGLVSEWGLTPELGNGDSSMVGQIRLDTSLPDKYSGAPVFNSRGLFIGLLVTTMRQERGEANGGVREIIPAKIVKQIAPPLVEKGFYPWAWLGVEGISLNLPLQEANQVHVHQGAYLDQILPGGPAEKAGLRGTSGTQVINGLEVPTGGDIILAIDSTPLAGYEELLQALAYRKPGEQVTITILQNGETKDVKIVLAEKPN